MCADYEPTAPRHLHLHLRTLKPTFSYPGEAYPGSKAVFVTAGENEQADFSPWPGVFGLLPPQGPRTTSSRATPTTPAAKRWPRSPAAGRHGKAGASA